MKKTFKKVLASLLVVVMLLTAAPMSGIADIDFSELFAVKASALASTGQCGDNVYWSYDSRTGLLTISGTGAMWDYSAYIINFDSYNGFSNDSITDSPFFGASIKTIVIENGVTNIGNGVFKYCSSLTSVTIPDSVTSIGDLAFVGCYSLLKIKIPYSVTSMGDSVFEDCDNLKNIYYSGTKGQWNQIHKSGISSSIIIHYCSDSATNGNCGANLYWNLDITSGLLTISGTGSMYNFAANTSPFYNNGSIKNIFFENGITSIGNYSFEYCSSLTSVTIPDGVTSIGSGAFEYCNNITNIMLPDSITYIGNYAFKNLNIYYLGKKEQWNKVTKPATFSNVSIQYCSESATNGKCGENLYWSLDIDSGELTISGTGDMYLFEESSPFYNNSSIKTVIIEKGIASIGDYAFENCRNLKNITISDNITSFGNYAFYGCSSLTSVTIPDSVTSIGNYAFYGCSSLTSVTIPDSITSIGDYVFSGCSSLSSITIPDSVTSIGDYALNSCDNLKEIYYTGTKEQWNKVNGSNNYSNVIIHYCSESATSGKCGNNLYWALDIDSGLLTISGTGKMTDYSSNDSPFYNNSFIKSVIIEEGVTDVGGFAFKNCTALISVAIPDSVTNAGFLTFYGCDNLKDIYYTGTKEQWNQIGGFSIFNNPKVHCFFDSETSGKCGENLYWNFDVDLGLLSINGTGEMYDFKGDNGNSPFNNNSSIKTVVIEYGITSIGSFAFDSCYGLSSITIPDSITSIGDFAFSSCSSLTSITIPDSVISVGSYTFGHCTNLTIVIIGDGVTSIGSSAFEDCNSLTSVTIGNSVTSIGNYAFSNCSSLTSITIPDSVTSIGEQAFRDCICLTDFTIPNSVTSIGEYAFYHMPNIVYNGIVTGSPWGARAVNGYIEDGLVYKDSSKKVLLACLSSIEGSVIIPDSVTNIGSYAFFCCSLTSIKIPDSVTSIGDYAFWGCGLKSITIPGSVVRIGCEAFAACAIETITLENGIKYIECYAFSECGLTSITIPDSVIYIGGSAFDTCYNLFEIYLPDSVELCSGGDGNPFKWTAYYDNPDNWENGVLYIGNHLIRADESLSGSYTVKPGTVEICGGAFDGCENLTEVIIPDSVKKIGAYAFEGTAIYGNPSNWENGALYIGDNLIAVDESVSGNYNVKPGTRTIASIAFYESSVTDLFIPESVVGIGCGGVATESLQSVTVDAGNIYYDSRNNCNFVIDSRTNMLIGGCGTVIPEGVTGIIPYGLVTFNETPKIYIPKSIENIACYGIIGCTNKVYFESTEEQWNIFFNAEYNELEYNEIYFNSTMPEQDEYIEVVKQADKTDYSLNSDFDTTGMIIRGFFNGVETVITDYRVLYDFSKHGNSYVTVLADYNGSIYSTMIPVSLHIFKHVMVEPTCMQAGQEYDICTECGEISNETAIPKAPHNLTHVVIPASCFGAGSEFDICVDCGAQVNVSVIPTLEHDLTHIHKDATCTEIGEDYDICEVCGQMFNIVETQKLSHKLTHITVDVTCTEDGRGYDICSECGQKFNEVVIPATGHTTTHVSIAKTCTVDGEEYDICSVCGEKLNHTVDKAKGHNYTHLTIPSSCTANGTEFDYCLTCGNQDNMVVVPASHNWGEWQIKSYPTTDTDGESERHCDKCGTTETKKLAKTLSGCTVDGNTIIGLNAGMTVSELITNNHIDNGVTVSVNPSEGNIGTGSKVTLTYSDGTSVEYNVVIFGDVNGDGWYDGTDSIIVNCLANGLLSREQVGEAVYMAADCNHDGVIDSADVALLEQAGLILASVDQSKSPEELMTDSTYVEYLNLIDQNPTEETPVEEVPTNTTPTDEPVDEGFNKNIIQRIIAFIVNFFRMIISYIPKAI